MPIAKPLLFGGIVATSLIFVGAARIATRTTAQTPEADPAEFLGQVGSEVRAAHLQGRTEGMRDATSPPTLDAALATRGAILDGALELAIADVDSLLCARAGQYLASAREAQSSQAADVERWLINQLNRENQAIKTLMATHGSLDGSATNATALDSPLRNRAAILQALRAVYAGESPSCRVAAFDSATQIDAFSFEAQRIKSNQQRAMVPQPTDGEVDNGDS